MDLIIGQLLKINIGVPATCRKRASTHSMLWTGFLRVTASIALAMLAVAI